MVHLFKEIVRPRYGFAGTAAAIRPEWEQVDLLRLVWCAGLVDDPGLTAALSETAEACFEKLESLGPRNLKIGHACLESLRRLGTPAAVDQLAGRSSGACGTPRCAG